MLSDDDLIKSVALKYKFSGDAQNEIFVTQARHMLENLNYRRLGHTFAAQIKVAHPKPMQMFVHGPGGTGKTEIVKALVNLLEVYQKQYHVEPSKACSVVCTAFTGVAADNIGGPTLNSLFKIYQNSKNGPLLPGSDSAEHIEKWASKCVLLVIDELSMISSDLFNMIEERLRTVASVDPLTGQVRNTEPFGGMNVLVLGDFFQLQPAGSPIYANFQKTLHLTSCTDSAPPTGTIDAKTVADLKHDSSEIQKKTA